ncbi:MAG TPA: helix-turn-helix transcriptional regulator [Burkholderiales bacterium]|nr:helix-turn-helix transcriptional regulator [Burkholderiales bacterium]
MARTEALIATLKKALKRHGLTYRNVAKALGLSEASVKRLFTQPSFSLDRLDKLCSLMGMEITDLVEMMEHERGRISELTESQEEELVSDTKLLLVAFLAVNGWTFHEILDYYILPEPELIRCLTRLDRLKLIELLPKNRIKLRISPNFAWRKNGPIQEFFNAHIREDFIKSRFEDEGEAFLFFSGMLSRSSNAVLLKKFEQLATEFDELNRHDRRLPIAQRFVSSMVLAIRAAWHPAAFEPFRRKKD